MKRLACVVLLAALAPVAAAHDGEAGVRYLANEGVLVEHDGRKVLFDPLFAESYGQYQLLPAGMRDKLFAGNPPFDGIDAVFVSHYHGDHFDPADMLALLREHGEMELFAPAQAVAAMQALDNDTGIFSRVTAVALDYGDPPARLERPGLVIEAVRIPHSGWPTRRVEVENIAWRITLDAAVTVVHLGDADTGDQHFARDAAYWDARSHDLALPPYWFFLSDSGRQVLGERLRPVHATGIHVPKNVPTEPGKRDPALREVDLFTRPGETRSLLHRH